MNRPFRFAKILFRIQPRRMHEFPGAYKLSGAIKQRPELMSFAVARSLAMSIPFICFGAYLSREGAAILEEMDIFVPEDDDD
ncbi:hypothetical protein FGIG_06340 [Fasciola gigantica]|uniref:Essential MCU regulator, mitochondrial n=1 Tax=Fasciola gigantica TaxID=46835 RepID=A0A504YS20_FASGI|nr:hypothetical protein FGIG_06340 [Fasciola gigantica]